MLPARTAHRGNRLRGYTLNTITIARTLQARSMGFPMLNSNQPVIYTVSGTFSERNRTSVWLEIGTALRGYIWLVQN